MFRASSCPSSEAYQLQQQPLVLLLECGDSSAVGRGRVGRPDHDQQHCYHHAPTVKPEAAAAVGKLLMMGMRMPETCWAVFKWQAINLRNCCIWLVDSFEHNIHLTQISAGNFLQKKCHLTFCMLDLLANFRVKNCKGVYVNSMA